MIYKQSNMPIIAQCGDAWVCPHNSFKRVLSRGGAWENVNLGEKHRDEVNHEPFSARREAQQQQPGPEVPSGASESTSGDGDDGQAVPESGGERGPEDPVLEGYQDDSPMSEKITIPEGEGVDANGSPVV